MLEQTIHIVNPQHLDGGGSILAHHFIDIIDQKYDTILEWCSGAGFIGYKLLEANLCENLILVDINPEAIARAEQTVVDNGLSDKVACYTGTIEDVPNIGDVDLIVANPPNYYNINPHFPFYDAVKNDLRPNDKGWNIHCHFFDHVSRLLKPQGRIILSEVEPFQPQVFLSGYLYDQRDRIPFLDFVEMIHRNGLFLERCQYFLEWEGIHLYFFVIRNAHGRT